MNYWITRINGFEQQMERASGLIANRDAAKAAELAGFKPLDYFKYNGRKDSNEELGARLDGILSAVKKDDLIVIQFPMWMPDLRFEKRFLSKLEAKKNAKKIAIVWDVLPWLHDDTVRDYTNDYAFKMFNRFDLLIAPNDKMAKRLIEEGGVKTPIISIGIWDYLYEGPLKAKRFEKKLFFVGSLDKTDFSAYQGETPLALIGDTAPLTEKERNQKNLIFLGEHRNIEIPSIFDGGFGVINYKSPKNKELRFKGAEKYGEYNNPLKLSLYLASGLPVIVESKSAHAELVKKNGIGLVMDDLNEIDEWFERGDSEDEYNGMLENVKNYSEAIRSGFFTQRALIEVKNFFLLNNDSSVYKYDV